MRTTRIFVRHGESDANGKGFFAGQWQLEQESLDAHLAELKTQFPENV